MALETFSCPSCGASLRVEAFRTTTVRCEHCDSTVILPEHLRPPATPPAEGFRADASLRRSPQLGVVLAIAGIVIIGLVWIIAAFNKRPSRLASNYNTSRPTPSPRTTPTPDNGIVLEFGGEGTGAGLFKDARSVAVDREGYIYVSDETLRIQRFDAAGNFVSVWMLPPETKWYRKARGGPDKILADHRGQLFVVISGVVLKLTAASGELLGAAHGTDRINDAALLPDGSLVLTTTKGEADDELVKLDAKGAAVRRVHRFVSSQLDKSIESRAVRVAVDGLGNIFAVYALGGLYGEFWYDSEDLQIFKFTPEGRYVTRFGSSGHGAGEYEIPTSIAVDSRGRVLVADQTRGVYLFAPDGRFLSFIKAPFWTRGMTLDAQDNLYLVGSNRVAKLVLRK